MYLIHGEDDFLISKATSKIIKENSDKKLIFLNSDTDFEDIFNTLNSIDLFANQKIIIFKNPTWLSSKKIDDKIHHLGLIKTLEQNNSDLELVFISNQRLTKSINDLTKFLFNYAKVVEINQLDKKSMVNFIQLIVKSHGGTISMADAVSLSSKLPNNSTMVATEVERLLLENKDINFSMIMNSELNFFSDDPFEFINFFTSIDNRGIVKAIHKQVLRGESILNLMGQISKMLILCSQIHSLKKSEINLFDMEKYLKIHHYRIKIANDFLDRLGYKKVFYLIEQILQLDKAIKSGKINELSGFNNYILHFLK